MSYTIDFFREKVRSNSLTYSDHAFQVLAIRRISEEDIKECINAGEIIEESDTSYLIYGKIRKQTVVLHVVLGTAKENDVTVVTAYFPDETKFEKDLKTRRKRK